MAEPLRHRQTKEAATDMFSLQPPRHISTLHWFPQPEVKAYHIVLGNAGLCTTADSGGRCGSWVMNSPNAMVRVKSALPRMRTLAEAAIRSLRVTRGHAATSYSSGGSC